MTDAYKCAFWFAYGDSRNVSLASRFAAWFELKYENADWVTGIEKAYKEYLG